MTSVSVCARVRDRESGLRTVMVGVGTTEGGLQVAPWTFVSHSGHVTVPVHVQHASPLFATVVTQNQAGLWSRFVSRQITLDRTSPVITDVTVTLSYTGEGNAIEVWAVGRWTATDEESGVEFCTCAIVGHPTTKIVEQSFNDVTGRCQWQLPRAHHGSEVAVTVTCVNNVQLVTVVTSRPTYILLQPPDVSQILLSSFSNNGLMSPYHSNVPLVRSSNSSLQFFWHGLNDPTVTAVNFRFLQQSRAPTEWSPLPAYKTLAVLEKGVGRWGEVTAEVKVANQRQMTSEVSASVHLDDTRPQLTGQKARVSTKDSKQLQLDWSGVFRSTRDVTFSLFVGSQPGYGDVINHVTTSATHYEGRAAVEVPSAVYVIIQAVYDNGLDTVYSDTVLM